MLCTEYSQYFTIYKWSITDKNFESPCCTVKTNSVVHQIYLNKRFLKKKNSRSPEKGRLHLQYIPMISGLWSQPSSLAFPLLILGLSWSLVLPQTGRDWKLPLLSSRLEMLPRPHSPAYGRGLCWTVSLERTSQLTFLLFYKFCFLHHNC